jgi:antitoxin ParD1/3/4
MDCEPCLHETALWLREQVAPAYDALKADPSRAVSAGDVRATLAAEHKKAVKKR